MKQKTWKPGNKIILTLIICREMILIKPFNRIIDLQQPHCPPRLPLVDEMNGINRKFSAYNYLGQIHFSKNINNAEGYILEWLHNFSVKMTTIWN